MLGVLSFELAQVFRDLVYLGFERQVFLFLLHLLVDGVLHLLLLLHLPDNLVLQKLLFRSWSGRSFSLSEGPLIFVGNDLSLIN